MTAAQTDMKIEIVMTRKYPLRGYVEDPSEMTRHNVVEREKTFSETFPFKRMTPS